MPPLMLIVCMSPRSAAEHSQQPAQLPAPIRLSTCLTAGQLDTGSSLPSFLKFMLAVHMPLLQGGWVAQPPALMPAEQPCTTLALALHPCSSQSGMGRKPSASHCPVAVLFMAPSTIWTTPACRQQLGAAEKRLPLFLLLEQSSGWHLKLPDGVDTLDGGSTQMSCTSMTALQLPAQAKLRYKQVHTGLATCNAALLRT